MTQRELSRLFVRERASFAETYPAAAQARLAVSRTHYLKHPKLRDVAWVERDGRTIVFVGQRLRSLTVEQATGVLRHELGHVCGGDTEREADKIAEWHTGQPIRYDREMIQTCGDGKQRPKSLRR